MQITTQPDENDEIINLEILADHESPINKIRLHGKTRHKRNKSLLDSFKDSFKKNVQQTFSKPNSRSSSQQLVHLSRKESKAETVDQDYMAIPSERDREDGYESHRIMTTEMSERKRPNPSRFEYRDTQGDEKDDEGEEEDKIELVDLPEIPSRSAESPFSQLRESILFNSVHGNNDLNEVVIKSTTSSEPDNKDKVLRTTSAASERWKSAKFALNAVTFNKGAEEALERRHALIMRGHTIEKLLKRKDIKFYINPHGVFKKMWDLIILITLIYYSFLAPVRWSQRVHSSAWVSVDAVLDALTGIDIILFFFTAIIEPTRTIKDNKQIVIQYLKTYFLFDLIAVLPFYKINQDTYIIKFLRVIHLPRIYQVLSSFVIGFPRGQKFLNFTKAFYLFCAALNFLTAIWIFPGEVPKGSVSWMASVTGFDPADTFANIWTLFITGAAFIVTTITTVGYGDIVPKNTTEDVVDMIFMFLGVILTGLLQGQLTYVMKADYKKQIQEVNTELEAWVLKLEHSRKVFRSEKGQDKYVDAIPPTKEMQTCFKFFNFHNLNPLTWHSEFFPELKPSAQNHVTFLIFSTVIQRFSVFFRFFNDEAFIKDLVTTLVPKILSPREIIFRRGGHAKGLYFIIKGHVVLSYKETSLVTLREGSFFGESSLLERKCMVDYIAGNEDLQCLYLPKKLVIEICEIYPEQKCLLQRIIYERADYYKKIISGIFIGTQNRFDEYTPFHARSQPENNGGRRSTKILRKAFMKEYINTSQTEQNISKDNHLKSPGLPEPFVFSYEDKPIMSNANLESCNYLSRTASFAHNIIPSFHASPTLFQPSPTSIVPQSPVNASPNLKPSAYQVTKPRDSIVPSIVIMSPRGQQQFNGFIPGQMDLILQPRQSAQSALLGNSMITEDQISDPDQEVDENQDIASTSSESEDEEDGGDSDSDASDLNNSLEVPLETIEPDFQDLKQFDKILQYVDERISSFDFHIKRVDLSSREKLLQEWKNMRAILKRVHPDLKEDGNIAEARIQEKPE